MERSVLHIGLHRTGTTSVQRFLRDHVGAPRYPVGYLLPDMHLELPEMCLRPGRRMVAPLDRAALPDTWRDDALRSVRAAVEGDADHLVMSCENLSFLRHDDELDRLADVLAGRDWKVVLVTRDPAAYLHSYSFAMRFVGDEPSTDPDLPTYVEPDTWLVDHPTRIAFWERWAPVTVVDDDAATAAEGSIIPTFARLVGVEPVEYRLNTIGDLYRSAVTST